MSLPPLLLFSLSSMLLLFHGLCSSFSNTNTCSSFRFRTLQYKRIFSRYKPSFCYCGLFSLYLELHCGARVSMCGRRKGVRVCMPKMGRWVECQRNPPCCTHACRNSRQSNEDLCVLDSLTEAIQSVAIVRPKPGTSRIREGEREREKERERKKERESVCVCVCECVSVCECVCKYAFIYIYIYM